MAPPSYRAVAGALLGALAGDCIGAPYEGDRPADAAGAVRRVRRALSRRRLRYTDDTQLLLALGDHLIHDDPFVDRDGLARRMLARYDDWRGYGAGMRRLVALWRDGVDVDTAATAVFPDGSFGNGAAMRVAPVGLRHADRPDDVARVAERSARVSHVHPVGIDGAVVQARAVAVAATSGGFTVDDLGRLEAATDEMRAGLAAAADLDASTPSATVGQVLGTAPVAHRSVPTALWCAATCGDVETTITRAVGLGGDTDTVACMAAAVRGAVDGPESLPAPWRDALEGVDEISAVARRLHASAGGADSRDGDRSS